MVTDGSIEKGFSRAGCSLYLPRFNHIIQFGNGEICWPTAR